MIDFLTVWGALVVAAIALVQPWVISLWKRYLRPQQIDVFEAGTIEIGFSDFGPTVGVQGTLRSVYGDAFIRGMKLNVVRETDQASHHFQWAVFRSSSFSPGAAPSFEACSSFLLAANSTFRYNIQFWELQNQEAVRRVLEDLKEAWSQRFMDSGGRQLLEQGANLAAMGDDLHAHVRELYEVFSREDAHVRAYTALNRIFYWEPGRYNLTLAIESARPQRTYRASWRFELREQDAENMRLNVLKSLQAACGQAQGVYNFAYRPYNSL